MEEQTLSNEELQMQIENGRDMQSLMEDERFIRLFTKGYVENWALTQVHNVAVYDPSSRGPVMEQMLARSVFSVYCEDIVTQGNIALDELRAETEAEVIDVEVE